MNNAQVTCDSSARYAARLYAPLLASFLAWAAPAEANDKPRACYSTIFDRDGDGYASAQATEVAVTGGDDLHCPEPLAWRDKAGDCDDFNANVHPRRDERGDNGIDDNCNGTIDEPVVYYNASGADGFDVESDAFSMVVRSNNAKFEQLQAQNLPLGAELMITPLRDSARSTLVLAHVVTPEPDLKLTRIKVEGLVASTVYRVQARLSFCILECSYTPWSDYYYGTTAGYTTQTNLRTRMVSSAFKQLNDSNRQLVGYRGKALDGKRYGADLSEMWCSEFYSWVADPFVRWSDSRPTSVEQMVDSFADYGAVYDPSLVRKLASRGDYLALDPDHDGDKNHSAMFLAWDASVNEIWTIEGNSGNEVRVNRRPLSQVAKLGMINESMFR